MNNKQYRVEYQNAFGFSPREEKFSQTGKTPNGFKKSHEKS